MVKVWLFSADPLDGCFFGDLAVQFIYIGLFQKKSKQWRGWGRGGGEGECWRHWISSSRLIEERACGNSRTRGPLKKKWHFQGCSGKSHHVQFRWVLVVFDLRISKGWKLVCSGISKVKETNIKILFFFFKKTPPSQEHCTNQITGFPIRKLIVVPLITFFGNNFVLSQCFLIRKLFAWWSNFAFPLATKYRTQMAKRQFGGTFPQKDGVFWLKNWISWVYINKKAW